MDAYELAEKKAQLKSQFRKMDKNGDNKLDFNEFLTLMSGLDAKTAHKLFEKVDKTGDGTVDFDEFVDYIYTSQRTTAGRHARLMAASAVATDTENESLWDTCMAVYETYEGSDKKFESRDFKKLCVDCKIFDRRFTKNDVDIIYSKYKPRGSNKIDFEAFKNCIRAVATKKGTSTEAIQAAVSERISMGVETTCTKADSVRFHDDKSSYTGMHTANEFHGTGGSADRSPDSRHARIKEAEAFNHGEEEALDWDKVQAVFLKFTDGDNYIEGREFNQLCQDCGLLAKTFNRADADIIFNKVKSRGERKIDFDQFKDACIGIARKRNNVLSHVQTLIMESSGPQRHGVTQADDVRFHDDKSLYTGMHAM
uniref:EF-hand domain-containing protein n=1 Tax=Alexandrium catenella TaxID=2925 RepID=A0A7S1S031_ALECA